MKENLFFKKLIALCLTLSFFAIPIGPLPARASEETEEIEKIYCDATLEDNFTEKEICVIIHPDWYDEVYTAADFAAINCVSVKSSGDGKVNGRLVQLMLLTIADVGKQKVLDAIQQLETREDIYAAHPNYLLQIDEDCEHAPADESETLQSLSVTETASAAYIPDDPKYADQWGLQRMSLPQAWTIETGSPTIYVGVIDSGIQGDHPDLENSINVELSKCFLAGAGDPLVDNYGHGTRMAGVIGAEANNQIGISGVCWDIQLVSLKVCSGNEGMDIDATCDAIQYAQDNGIQILNYSAGWNSPLPQIRAKIEAYSGLFVCSAGNNGEDNDDKPFYPAEYDLDNILVVAACKPGGRMADSTNFGKASVDVFAPGEAIVSTSNNGGYTITYGTSTSLAAAYVSGVAALILSAYPDITWKQIKDTIVKNVDIVYDSNGNSVFMNYCSSGGIVNAYKALQHVYDYATTESGHTGTCEDCGYSYTEVHSWVTEQIDSSVSHARVCSVCGYAYDENHFWIYTATESLYYHTAACRTCGYTYSQAHTWTDMGTYYRCNVCRMTSTSIPVVSPYAAIYSLTDGEAQVIDSNTVLCYINGQYYLVKATTETEAITYLNNQEVGE